jgi:exonuclease III
VLAFYFSIRRVELAFLTWNIRGLNDCNKRKEVKDLITTEKPHLVCLQETKLGMITDNLVKEIVGPKLQAHEVILANGTAGGLIIAWNSNTFKKVASHTLTCCATIDLQMCMDDTSIRVTRVYGPSTPQNRRLFFQELLQSKPTDTIPWLICGDFNQTLQSSDRSTMRLQQDESFRQIIHALALTDVQMQGRNYTWTNGRTVPSFVRLDRFLTSNAWNNIFPNTSQHALPSTVSDHCPIKCIC